MTKPTIRRVPPGKIHISLCICTHLIRVFADRMCLLQSPSYPKKDKGEPFPYWLMFRLIWVFADHSGLNVGFVVCWLKAQIMKQSATSEFSETYNKGWLWWKLSVAIKIFATIFFFFFNPPPQSRWEIIEMAFVCPSVRLSFLNTFLSAPYLLSPLKDFH